MKKTIINILRWIALLPAALIGSRLVVVLLNIINPIVQLTNNLPFAEYGNNTLNFVVEYVVSAYLTIAIADYIAPSNKNVGCWITCSVFSALYLAILFLTLFLDAEHITPLVDIIGSVLYCITLFATTVYFSRERKEN